MGRYGSLSSVGAHVGRRHAQLTPQRPDRPTGALTALLSGPSPRHPRPSRWRW